MSDGEVWLEGEFGMIVGQVLDVRREGSFVVVAGEFYGFEEHEKFTARIPLERLR